MGCINLTVTCPTGYHEDPNTHECVQDYVCNTTNCPSPKTCVNNVCLDPPCVTNPCGTGCPDALRCDKCNNVCPSDTHCDSNTHVCVPDSTPFPIAAVIAVAGIGLLGGWILMSGSAGAGAASLVSDSGGADALRKLL